MEVARTAIRNGTREVFIMYRSGEADIRGDKAEVEYTKIDGVKFEYYKMPIELVENTTNLFATDSIIIAISQGPRDIIVTSAKTVVEAVRLSKIVADAIDDYVQGYSP